jgi:hypothetical protein
MDDNNLMSSVHEKRRRIGETFLMEREQHSSLYMLLRYY